MTFEEAKKSIRWILTVSHPIGSWELENIMDALDITPCDISTCKVAKALWGNKGNIPDIDISRVKNGTPLEAQQNRCDSCAHSEEQDGSNCYECVKGMADNFEAQPKTSYISVDVNKFAKEVAEKALDEITYEGKTIREWVEIIVKKQQSWIPVSERLPETDGVYIVTRRLFDKQVDTEPYYMVDACYFDGSNTWHNDNRINHSRHLLEDIIAWMPLSQPYRESEE